MKKIHIISAIHGRTTISSMFFIHNILYKNFVVNNNEYQRNQYIAIDQKNKAEISLEIGKILKTDFDKIQDKESHLEIISNDILGMRMNKISLYSKQYIDIDNDYVMIIGSDDFVSNDILIKMIDFMESNNLNIVFPEKIYMIDINSKKSMIFPSVENGIVKAGSGRLMRASAMIKTFDQQGMFFDPTMKKGMDRSSLMLMMDSGIDGTMRNQKIVPNTEILSLKSDENINTIELLIDKFPENEIDLNDLKINKYNDEFFNSIIKGDLDEATKQITKKFDSKK